MAETVVVDDDGPRRKIGSWRWPAIAAGIAVVLTVAGFLMVAPSRGAGAERCLAQGPPRAGYILNGWSPTPRSTECEWRGVRDVKLDTEVPSPLTEVVGYVTAMLALAALPWLGAVTLWLAATRYAEKKRSVSAPVLRGIPVVTWILWFGCAISMVRAATYL